MDGVILLDDSYIKQILTLFSLYWKHGRPKKRKGPIDNHVLSIFKLIIL